MTKILDTFWVGGYGLAISFQDKDLLVKSGDYIVIEDCIKIKILGVETYSTANIEYNNSLPRTLLLEGLNKNISFTNCNMELFKDSKKWYTLYTQTTVTTLS